MGRHCDCFVVEDGGVVEAFVGVVEGCWELWECCDDPRC